MKKCINLKFFWTLVYVKPSTNFVSTQFCQIHRPQVILSKRSLATGKIQIFGSFKNSPQVVLVLIFGDNKFKNKTCMHVVTLEITTFSCIIAYCNYAPFDDIMHITFFCSLLSYSCCSHLQ